MSTLSPCVSSCYVFKSRLQEYAQKVGLPTPVYETIKEGPSHQPSFRSTVIVDDVRYDSLLGFFNRKAAEQSAAEVALVELAKIGKIDECVSQPVHETGLCKNLLQEYAQKMNYAIPLYICQRAETKGRMSLFSCTVEIGGMKYIGAAARTKKEAEIKAARTALLAIRSSPSGLKEKPTGDSVYTVVPSKKKGPTDLGISSTQETTSPLLKPKKGRFKKRPRRNRRGGDKGNHFQVENMGCLGFTIGGHEGHQLDQATYSGLLTMAATANFQDQRPSFDGNDGEKSAAECALVQNDRETSYHGITNTFNGDGSTSRVSEVNTVPGIGQVASMVNNPPFLCQGEVPRVVDGLTQTACGGGAGSKQG